MKPVPQEYISAIPDDIEASKADCQDAADNQLLVLFFMAGELDAAPAMPPIFSNGVEVYPLPPPYQYEPPMRLGGFGIPGIGPKIDTDEVLATVNEWLAHTRKNAEAYNQALAVNDLPTAVKIADQGVKDSAYVWSTCNALARSVETDSVYRTLDLSDDTQAAYYEAVGIIE